MAFLSGLWIPIEMLPPAIKNAAPFLPAYHFAQLALGAARRWPWSTSLDARAVSALAGFTIVGVALALSGYRRYEDRMFG